MKIPLLLLAVSFVAQPAAAAPVVYDVDGAKVIVHRPVDSWSGHKEAARYLLECIGEPKIAYFYIGEDGKTKGGVNGLWVKREENALVKNVDTVLAKAGYSAMGHGRCSVTVGRPVSIRQDEIPAFVKTQNSLFDAYVLSQGDPAEVTGRVTRNRYLGAAFSFAMMGVGIEKLAHLGSAGTAFATSLGQDISLLSAPSRKGLAPLPLRDIDLSGYQSIDVRAVQSAAGDRIGQIIIAYPSAKDDEVESKALAKAIFTSAGGDTDQAAVQAARDADYANRLEMWRGCVTADKCKP